MKNVNFNKKPFFLGFLGYLAAAAALPATAMAAAACDKKNPTAKDLSNCLQTNPIVKDLNMIINFLSAGVGVIVIAVIILGGIQYSMAGDSPEATAKAKQRIMNGLIALLAFIFIFAFLQWLIPGGIFN
jgi:hypothetical protein